MTDTTFALALCLIACASIIGVNAKVSVDGPINEEPEGGVMPMDEIIVNAANSSVQLDFFYDENYKFLKVEYDIVYSFEEYEAMQQALKGNVTEGERKKRTAGLKAGRGGANRWENNVVHFQFMPHFSGKDINTIHAAIADWEKYTCLDFRQDNRAKNRIQFMNGGGCYSRLGMVGGTQDLGLAEGCRYKGVVMHEIGHALGLHHEQTRPDRDNYIRIMRGNIPKHIFYNFEKQSWDTMMNLGIPYDYRSIMHYGKTAFSSNGQLTIRTNDPKYQNVIGNRKGLSFSDIKTVNLMYNCKKHKRGCSKTDNSCPGEGFVGKDCKCWCAGPDLDDPVKPCKGGGGGGTRVTPRPTPRPTARPTPRPTPRPTQRPSSCRDQHRSCSYWSRVGECGKNPDYMHIYCKKSCNKCGGGRTGGGGNRKECKDKHHACSQWKNWGYCTTRYPHIVRPKCPKSCGLCSSGTRDEVQGKSSSSASSANCVDSNSYCKYWSQTGECTKNPAYMLQTCKKSCNQCGAASQAVRSQVVAQPQRTNNVYCVDSNTMCGYWRNIGQCRANAAYMLLYCKRSCGVC